MPVNLGPGGSRYRQRWLKNGLSEYNLRVIVSGSGTLNPRAHIFKSRISPIIVLASGRAAKARLRRLSRVADEVKVFGDRELDFRAALAWLRSEWNVNRLLCEGGGEVNAGLFRAGLVDEIHLTLCPFVFGGRQAPTMADGDGIAEVADATTLRLKSATRAGDELFLVYCTRKKRWS
jgi:2,5-diamino-6-(ribosylamino)-4(3H)-pyrimidinone 5'-phosphate reductase